MSRRWVAGRTAVILMLVLGLVLSCGTSCRQQAKTPEEQEPVVTPEDYIVRETGAFPLYPDPGVGTDYVECIALCNLYDSLVFPELDGSIKPHVATDWEVSPDGLKYTFHLKQGVKFHDGTELDAEDVVFSMKRLLTMGEGFAYLFVDSVQDVRAPDRYTVEFALKSRSVRSYLRWSASTS